MSHNLLVIEQNPTIGDLISCEDFSTLHRLLRVTAYVVRAVNRFKAKKKLNSDYPSALTPQEIAIAERLWIIHAQTELIRQKDFDSLKHQFGLFLEDRELWRCGGRLQHVDISFAAKYPILIVQDAHQRVSHNGVKETLTEIRQRYLIVKGRSLIPAIIHRCIVCKKHEGASFRGPPPPPLPEFRIKEDPVFTYTGVDFAGPLFVRGPAASVSRKVWICLFTCLVT